jgi:arylsulfatase A-like enzyme
MSGSDRVQDRRVRQVAQHARDRDNSDGTVHAVADRGRNRASIISTAFSPARRRNGSRGWSRSFNPIEPPHDEKYHLSEDLAGRAITWMRQHRSFAPDKPFLMYWAPGAAHGPHHIFKEWADKYKGQFDDGWDALRERIFARLHKQHHRDSRPASPRLEATCIARRSPSAIALSKAWSELS